MSIFDKFKEKFGQSTKKRGPSTTIGKLYVPDEELEDDWCELSNTLKVVYEGKVLKYFEKEVDLSGYKIRTGIVGLELRHISDDINRGYVIVGERGYEKRLDLMKRDYQKLFGKFEILQSFDNRVDRAGFFWQDRPIKD